MNVDTERYLASHGCGGGEEKHFVAARHEDCDLALWMCPYLVVATVVCPPVAKRGERRPPFVSGSVSEKLCHEIFLRWGESVVEWVQWLYLVQESFFERVRAESGKDFKHSPIKEQAITQR